ncbi:MAG: nitroreductase [Pseudooceanicola sp.]|nr:nitroreductase [Pseudooceanicola sp.]
MLQPNPAALDFLLTRRSRPAKTLTTPVPSRDELQVLLTAAARVPDHGKLEPWRFVVIEAGAMPRLAELAAARGAELGKSDEDIAKGRGQYDQGNLAVVVIEKPVDSPKIPRLEQTYSAACVCLSLVNAALASGWGACWLTGWPAHDAAFCARAFGTVGEERVAGIVHVGTEGAEPPDRPRPDVVALTTWLSE